MIVIIAGGRTFKDYELLKSKMNFFLKNTDKASITIVSGGQVSKNKKTGEKYGADYLGEQYAKEMGFPVKVFPADWDAFGKRAGIIRNEEMANYAKGEGLVAFWDGKSKGTASMIKLGKKYNLKVKVVNY